MMSDHEGAIEITPAARATISREIKAQWDGRELGGALVGHTYGARIVVSNGRREFRRVRQRQPRDKRIELHSCRDLHVRGDRLGRLDTLVQVRGAPSAAPRTCSGRHALAGEDPEHLAVESRNVVRLPACDDVAVDDDLRIGPLATGVADVRL
jgi:hypothetical protein